MHLIQSKLGPALAAICTISHLFWYPACVLVTALGMLYLLHAPLIDRVLVGELDPQGELELFSCPRILDLDEGVVQQVVSPPHLHPGKQQP